MSTTSNRAGATGRAGCPPILEIDLVHHDALGPAVEWPPAPPTRGLRHATARRERTNPLHADPEVTQLTASRAMHLLDATVEHLRTALETSPDQDTLDTVEEAISDVERARDVLGRLELPDVTTA